MTDIDFDELEEELDILIPNIYRMFIDAVTANGFDLSKVGIYNTTEAVLKGNWHLRMHLADSKPAWENEYFDFGLGDGCGNYFFLDGTDEDCGEVQLWSHDPAGLENAGSAAEFFAALLAEIKAGFKGPNQNRFQGNGTWD